MRLTGLQIAAAMALADLTRTELAATAKIGRTTLDKIIKEEVTYRQDTIDKIRGVLELRGIEFTEQNGVRQKAQGVDMKVGTKGLQQFFDGVYEYARQYGGTIVQFGVDEKKFLKYLGSDFSQNYMKRMANAAQERKDIIVQAIICEGDKNFLASEYNEYRWISKEIFKAVPFYIYGEKLAIMDFQTDPAPTIIILKFPAITNAYRTQFEAFWNMAHKPAFLNTTSENT